mmetsp:Transcript_61661/g.145733  ORF Transcript_61661/g.145733 Transcript_61661/m.145733 type:complete len:88 (+) Transcript_61661:184-447(+)
MSDTWRRSTLQHHGPVKSVSFGLTSDIVVPCTEDRVWVWRRGQEQPRFFFPCNPPMTCMATASMPARDGGVWFAAGDKGGNVYMLGD